MEYGEENNSYLAAGKEEGLYLLAKEFYNQMESLQQADKIRRMHPLDLTESIDKLALFLCGWLGGPKLYREKYGSISIPRAHAHLKISKTEQDCWLLCMEKALEKTNYSDHFKQYLLEQLAVPASRCVNI